jgi:mannose/cellobiose epimerase-like protein (N-acyl-D-glucosamine 2-epimerase family)
MRARSEARDLSGNRLQAYDDQLAALARVRAAVADDPAKRALVDEVMATTREIARRDRALFLGDESTPSPASAGLEGVLERTTR